jgi:hypothetical protein
MAERFPRVAGRPVTHTSGPAGPIFTLDVLIDGDAIILR